MGTVPNSNRKIVARDKLDTAITRTHGRSLSPITRTHGRSLSWLGTGSSTKMMEKLN
jgi:hypothetical protein